MQYPLLEYFWSVYLQDFTGPHDRERTCGNVGGCCVCASTGRTKAQAKEVSLALEERVQLHRLCTSKVDSITTSQSQKELIKHLV